MVASNEFQSNLYKLNRPDDDGNDVNETEIVSRTDGGDDAEMCLVNIYFEYRRMVSVKFHQ